VHKDVLFLLGRGLRSNFAENSREKHLWLSENIDQDLLYSIYLIPKGIKVWLEDGEEKGYVNIKA
jgi:hypothetical protein